MIHAKQLHKALLFAFAAHNGQKRKSGGAPYIIHPVAVALLIADAGGDDNTIIAGLLHDTVEDTPVTLGQIRNAFGSRVAELVKDVTETDKTLSWAERKHLAREHIAEMDHDAVLLKSADVLHNLTSLIEDYRPEAFNTSPKNLIENYGKVVKALEDRWPDHNPLLLSLKMALEEVDKYGVK